MLNKYTAAIGALAAVSFAGQALAQTGQIDNQTYGVGVEINVAEEVSLWAGHENVTLDMQGNDGNNSALYQSTLSVITNVDANVQADVSGTLPPPTPGSSNGGISFFLFYDTDATTAQSAIDLNGYTPAGALAWDETNLGTSQQLIASTGATHIADTRPLTYASTSPGEIPDVGTYNLTVTYTIAPNI